MLANLQTLSEAEDPLRFCERMSLGVPKDRANMLLFAIVFVLADKMHAALGAEVDFSDPKAPRSFLSVAFADVTARARFALAFNLNTGRLDRAKRKAIRRHAYEARERHGYPVLVWPTIELDHVVRTHA